MHMLALLLAASIGGGTAAKALDSKTSDREVCVSPTDTANMCTPSHDGACRRSARSTRIGEQIGHDWQRIRDTPPPAWTSDDRCRARAHAKGPATLSQRGLPTPPYVNNVPCWYSRLPLEARWRR
jgi:hypothetical protein